MLRLRDRFVEWASTLEPDFTDIWRAGRRLASTLALAIAVAALLAVTAWVPPLRGLFGLSFWPLFGLWLLVIGAARGVSRLDAEVRLSPAARGLAVLAVACLVQLFASGIVVFSEGPGSYILAVGPMVGLWVHGLVFRPTLRAPFLILAHAVGMLAAFALRPTPDKGVILLLAFVLGAAGALAVGTLAAGGAEQRASLATHRTAIEAQVLEAQALERERVAATIEDLGERARQARALVSSGLRAVRETSDPPESVRDPAAHREASALVRGIRGALERIDHALTDAEAPSGEAAHPVSELEVVDVIPVAGEVLAQAARRFPDVALAGPPTRADGPRALLNGGEESLRRILESLVENACEGDGARAARVVEVSITPVDETGLEVIVRDDGPGFRPELLASPVRAFATTKAEGTGLGLYTATLLAVASGGALRRENAAGGGAAVTLRLRRAPAPARGAS